MKVICKNDDVFFNSLNGILTLNKSYHVISSIQRIQMDQQLALGLSEYNTSILLLVMMVKKRININQICNIRSKQRRNAK
jgi:hypothetical protein